MDGHHSREIEPEALVRVRARLATLMSALRAALARPDRERLGELVDRARWARFDVDVALSLKGHVTDLRDEPWRTLRFSEPREARQTLEAFLEAPVYRLPLVEMRNLRARLDGLIVVTNGWIEAL